MADELSEWEREQAFWKSQSIETFEIENVGGGYSEYREMVKQDQSRNGGYFGDWVRASDYRAAIEKLESEIAKLKNDH